MGLTEQTAIIFTTDHGFYFGEHGGLFGKMTSDKRPDGTLRPHGGPGSKWAHSPLYEELVHIPLLIHVPGMNPGAYGQLTSVVDVMPTVLDMLSIDIPSFVDGRSLLPALRDTSLPGREFVVSSLPFANPGDSVHLVDNLLRVLDAPPVTTVTTAEWSLLYSTEAGISEMYNLASDPLQLENVIAHKPEVANDLHRYLVRFMRETGLPDFLLRPRLDLRL
jgi:arylsulfatase A-like enzyme